MDMNRKIVLTSACALIMGGLLQTQAVAAEAAFTGASVMLTAPVCGEAHLRISSDNIVINRSFDSCADMTFSAVDDAGLPLADGLYHYDLTLLPQAMVDDQEALQAALDESDEAAFEELSNRLLSHAVTRDAGMFRVSGGVVSEYNEIVYEAEAQAEMETAQEAATGQRPSPGERSGDNF